MPSFPRRPLRRLALVLSICGGAAVSLTGASSASAAQTCGGSSLANANTLSSCWMPFASSSVFTTRLGANPPLAGDSAAVQRHMAAYNWSLAWNPSTFTVGDGSRPVYFAGPSDPVMTIHCTSSAGPGTCQGANGVDINGARINVPAGARPESNWDGHMTIIETATGNEYDLWRASVSGSTITSGTGAETNVNSADGTGSGGDAANLALSAGLLRPSELATGHIDHALAIVVPCTDATGFHVGYTWPATGGWGQACGQGWNEQASSAPALGQLMKLAMTPAQIANSGAPQWEQTIMTALANYGAYIEDTGGLPHQMSIVTESSSSWTDIGAPDQWAALARSLGQHGDNLISNVPIPTQDLEVVNTCVEQGTCAGGGSSSTVSRFAHAHTARIAQARHTHRARRHSRRHHRSHHRRRHHHRAHHRGRRHS